MTGNAESLKLTGTVDGAKVAYKDNKALDLNTKYTVTVPELSVARANVVADTTGTFVQVGSLQIAALTANTTYADQNAEVPGAPGTGDLPTPGPQARASSTPAAMSFSTPTTRSCTCRRWRCGRRGSSGGPRLEPKRRVEVRRRIASSS